MGVHSHPLRDIVGVYSHLLDNLVGGCNHPQTYIEPKGSYIGGATTTVDCLGQPRDGAPPKERKIQSASLEREDGESWLSLEFEDGGGDCIAVESSDKDVQAEGQRELEQLCASAGLTDINEPAELIGRTVYLQGGRYVPALDDDMQDAA